LLQSGVQQLIEREEKIASSERESNMNTQSNNEVFLDNEAGRTHPTPFIRIQLAILRWSSHFLVSI
jgi:hypothetical protein